jgi:hypothetical protein
MKNKQIPDPDYKGNWIEDYVHKNGNYINECSNCGNFFLGHKRRVRCKLCMGLPPGILRNEDGTLVLDIRYIPKFGD